MEEPNKGGGATSSSASGATDGKDDSTKDSTETKKAIQPEDHERALADLNKYKSKALTVEKELHTLKEQMQGLQDDKLKGSNDFKTLWEKSQEELGKTKEQLKTLRKGIELNAKMNALRGEASKLGLRQEAEEDLERFADEVALEWTSEGRAIPHGADLIAQKLKSSKSHWFKPTGVSTINSGGGTGTPPVEELTIGYMLDLETKDKKKYKELWPKFVEQQAKKRKQS